MGGSELSLELESCRTVLEVKGVLEAKLGIPRDEQRLVLGTVELQDKSALKDVEALEGCSRPVLTVVRQVPAPWRWPSREVEPEPGVLHSLVLFEDPEVTVSEVKHVDFWDSDDDFVREENWRTRGLRCIPSIGEFAGQELFFTYGIDGKYNSFACQLGSRQEKRYCELFGSETNGGSCFVRKCTEVAMSMRDGLTEVALANSSLPQEHLGDRARSLEVSVLGGEGVVRFQVPLSASFAVVHHTAAAALFKAGHTLPDGFSLWTSDGAFWLPGCASTKFWQPTIAALGQPFRCVAVPRSARAVAIVGAGVFDCGGVPPLANGAARVGFAVAPSGSGGAHMKAERLAGLKAMDEAARPSLKRDMRAKAIAIGGLFAAAHALPDDGKDALSASEGTVLQLFELSEQGAVCLPVRETSDGNMCGGSHHAVAVPAGASSRTVLSFLRASLARTGPWLRLGSQQDHMHALHFDELLAASQEGRYFDGLSVSACSHE